MFSYLFVISVAIGLSVAKPQQPAPAPLASTSAGAPPIAIVNQNEETNPDGSFQFSYETGNGIKVEEKGYLKDGANASEKIQVIEGSFSYTDSEGNPINLKYIADENGFQPEGDHIPKAPGAQIGAQPGAPLPVVPQPYSNQPAPQPAAAIASTTISPSPSPQA